MLTLWLRGCCVHTRGTRLLGKGAEVGCRKGVRGARRWERDRERERGRYKDREKGRERERERERPYSRLVWSNPACCCVHITYIYSMNTTAGYSIYVYVFFLFYASLSLSLSLSFFLIYKWATTPPPLVSPHSLILTLVLPSLRPSRL